VLKIKEIANFRVFTARAMKESILLGRGFEAGKINPYTCPHNKNAENENFIFLEYWLHIWFQKC
jgi:hypothetical protein